MDLYKRTGNVHFFDLPLTFLQTHLGVYFLSLRYEHIIACILIQARPLNDHWLIDPKAPRDRR